ncbi:MAG: hypothetical protein Q7N50_13130 [Armatimonadota bacterium]|nr:hypothetical protein [Armatimonadota bacterium]
MPGILSDFVAIVGWELWEKRWQVLQQQFNENPLLSHYFIERHSLELALFDLIAYRRHRGRLPNRIRTRGEYQLCSFMPMVVSFYQRLTPSGRDRLAGRLRDGLQSENLIALQHEMHVAAHFMQNGYDVEPFDLLRGGGVDFVVTKGDMVAEVECKLASADVGKTIHRRRMLELSHELFPVLKNATLHINGGQIVTVVLAGRLTGQSSQHKRIAEGVAEALSNGKSVLSAEEFIIQHESFDLAASPFWDVTDQTVSDEILRSFVTRHVGNPNAHAFVHGIARKCTIVVVTKSERLDKVAIGIYKQLKDATKSQFSGMRPGVLAVGLSDLTATQLEDLARTQRSSPNALQGIATRLFNNATRAFLHTVAFVPTGGMQRRSEISGTRRIDVVTDDGPSYTFKNANNQHGKDPLYDFFDAAPLHLV